LLHLHRLTCPRQRPFRDPSINLGIRPVIREPTTWRSSRCLVPISCWLSPAGLRFLGILFPPEDSAFLTVGLPAPRTRLDSVGVPVFRTHQTRPGWVPSLLRGGGVVPITVTSMTGACRFTATSPVPRHSIPSCGAWDHEAYEDSLTFTRPAFPLPVTLGWNKGPSASSLGFAPHGYPQRTPRREQSLFDTGLSHTLVNRSSTWYDRRAQVIRPTTR